MVGPAVRPGRQALLEQLMVLPASVRVVAGAVMLAMAVAGIVLGVSVYSVALLGLGVVLGLPLLLLGLRDRKLQQVATDERRRAEAELPALREAIHAAVAAKHDVARLLLQSGYTSDKVRRWIALECDVVLPKGEP